MNDLMFARWYEKYSGQPETKKAVWSAVLSQVATVDSILADAIRSRWDVTEMIQTLKRIGVDVTSLEGGEVPVGYKPLGLDNSRFFARKPTHVVPQQSPVSGPTGTDRFSTPQSRARVFTRPGAEPAPEDKPVAVEMANDPAQQGKKSAKTEKRTAGSWLKSWLPLGKEEGEVPVEPATTNKSSTDSGSKKTSDAMRTVVVTALAVLIMITVGLFVLSSLSVQGYTPVIESTATPITEAQSPLLQPDQLLPLGVQPEGSDPQFEPKYWFDKEKIKNVEIEPFLDKPDSILDFFVNFPWRWLLFIGFLLPLNSLTKQDRFAAAEKTDNTLIRFGLWTMYVLVLGAVPISILIEWLASLFGQTWDIPSGFIVAVGVLVNFALQLAASISGKRDFTALNIPGLFFTGNLFVWWFPENVALTFFGWSLMIAAIISQSFEISKTNQGGRSISIAVLMITLLLLGFGFWMLAAYAFTFVPEPSVMDAKMRVWGLFLYFIQESKVFIGAIIGLAIAYLFGDGIATRLLGPVRDRGSSHEDSPASVAQLDVTVKYDAMAYGVMLMYVLSFAAYWILAFLGK